MKLMSAVLVLLLATPLVTGIDTGCPCAVEIEPCFCRTDKLGNHLNCNNINSTQLRSVLSHNNLPHEFTSLSITNGNIHSLTYLPEKVSFEEIQIVHQQKLNFVAPNAFAGSNDTLRQFNAFDSALRELSFLTDELPQYSKLERLDVRHSPVKCLDSFNSTSLDYVDISHTDLKSIPPDTFVEVPKLATIYMHHNHITAIEAGTFNVDAIVKGIHIDFNKISYFMPGAFYVRESRAPTTEEMVLNFSHNQLTRLLPETFPLTDRPYHFNLFVNNIHTIDAGAFVMPDSKEYFRVILWLDDNSLTSVDEKVWGELFPYITGLNLSRNPLKCDCHVAWIVRKAHYQSKIIGDTTCEDGTPFADLVPADFKRC